MSKYQLYAYLDNGLANTFHIPVYRLKKDLFFQKIAFDNEIIEAFEPVGDGFNESLLVKYDAIKTVKSIGSSALYLFRFEKMTFTCEREKIFKSLRQILKGFDAEKNLFFIKDLFYLFPELKTNLIKYFFSYTTLRYKDEELIYFMQVIFRESEKYIRQEIAKLAPDRPPFLQQVNFDDFIHSETNSPIPNDQQVSYLKTTKNLE